MPDVPAVYFVSPTLANIKRIASDLEKNLYESFHLNFAEPLPRALLEELAAAVARDGTGEQVEQVCPNTPHKLGHELTRFQVLDQYLSFIAPSPSLFSLVPPPSSAATGSSAQPEAPASAPEPHSTYTILNSPASSEQQIEGEIERIATGLFSVVATMGK